MKLLFALSGIILLPIVAAAQITLQEYQVLLSHFRQIRSQTTFPVHNYDQCVSAFGPRIQSGRYDWHRGIDISGDIGDPIVAPLEGVFWRYRYSSSGGYTLTLRHDFPETVTLNGYSFDHFYTRYLHLYDDEIAGNGSGTDDIIEGWVEQSTLVTQGQVIGEMGDSGATWPHLHYELRIGTRLSLEYQTENESTFNYGFDPHVHPMLLFEPYPYTGFETNAYQNYMMIFGSIAPTNDLVLDLYSSNDDMPLFNRYELVLFNGDGSTSGVHTLDYNLRTGVNAVSTALLDVQETNKPYIEPFSFGSTPTNFHAQLIVPPDWMMAHGVSATNEQTLQINLFDIWGNPAGIQVPLPALRTDLDIQPISNQHVNLSWDMVPGQRYQLQSSTNLIDWADVPDGLVTSGINQVLITFRIA